MNKFLLKTTSVKTWLLVLLVGFLISFGSFWFAGQAIAQAYQRVTFQPGDFLQLGSYQFVQLDSAGTLMALESVFLCPTGSYIDGGSCQLCTNGLDNCAACASAAACHVCEVGYHLENFKCVPDCDQVANCNTCSSPQQCAPTGCQGGYFTNTTTGSCDSCTSLDGNCLTCSSTGGSNTCSTCTTGYYPDGSSCTSCGSILDHCTSCSNSSTCLTCEAGYHVEAGSCVPDCAVTNCNICSSSNYCSDVPGSCGSGYYSDGGGCLTCSSSITGCSECSDGSTCTTCRAGYTLEANGRCIPTGSVPDCSIYSDPDVCSSCSTGYYLDTNTCLNCNAITANCDSCTDVASGSASICQDCDPGYNLDFNTNTCVLDCNPTGGNCLSCSIPNYCAPAGCNLGYFSAGGICSPCSSALPYCSSCSDGATCLACETGYHVENGTCVLDCNPTGGNCNTCDSPDHCAPTGCATGYTANPTTGQCEMNCSVANCVDSSSCYAPDKCSTCNSGYYPNPANGACNACSGLHADCLTCTDGSTCTSCGGSSYLNGNTCESCSLVMTGCDSCNDGSTCTACTTGYNLVGGSCVPTGSDPNCNVYTAPEVCAPTGCDGGYYSNAGTCATCITGCDSCSDGATCNTCTTGYYLDSSGGTGNTCTSCSSSLPGCTVCSNSSTCTACTTGYDLVGGVCVPAGNVTNCSAYSAPDVCSSCSGGYYLNSNTCPACTDTLSDCLTCTSAGNCTSCDTGTILHSGECGVCPDVVANCSSCDGVACTGCASGHYLDNGACTSCGSIMTGCTACSDSSTCTACGAGYNLVAGACIPTGSVSNCTTYSAPDDCSSCAPGYTLNDIANTCEMNCNPAGGNCNTCTTPDYCSPTGCATGYFSNLGVCAQCSTSIPGCTTCSSGAICTSCDTSAGYVLDSDTCRPIPATPTNLTIPTPIYNSQTITISWDSSTDATGYILERSCGASAWSQVYAGAILSATNSLADCDEPAQYRVKAYNTLTTIASPYTTSTPQNYAACSDTNCDRCSDVSTCVECSSNYLLDGGTCVPESNEFNGNMQDFTAAMCDSYVTPVATGYTLVGTMTDSRDGKTYEIRKFADGKCWMADNLAYGGDAALGGTDACASKTTFDGCGDNNACSGGASKTGSAWGYGDCRDPNVSCNPNDYNDCLCASDGYCGYLYNWQAVMQHASAYYNNNYTGPTTNVQGICPTGWHLPSGNTGGEFANLDIANSGTGAYRSGCTTASCNFFRPGYNFKGVYVGISYYDGILAYQGAVAGWWSSTEAEYENNRGYNVSVGSNSRNNNSLDPGVLTDFKHLGVPVRCVKNTFD